MIISLLFLLLGFALLIGSAHYLVNSATSLAETLHVPARIIGMTIIAFGTSAPELVVNISAAFSGHDAIVFGNVVGSNILNILLILGISALIAPLSVERRSLKYEIPLCIVVALLLIILSVQSIPRLWENFRGLLSQGFISDMGVSISRIDAVILLLCFVLFLLYSMRQKDVKVQNPIHRHYTFFVSIVVLVVSLIFLALGGRLIVHHATILARYFEISERLIAILVISLGTSLPELSVSLVAIFKKQHDIALGNIIGSNIFNVFFVLGISTLIKPIHIDHEGFFDLCIHLLSVVLLFLIVLFSKVPVVSTSKVLPKGQIRGQIRTQKKLGRLGAALLVALLVMYYVILI